ncbi:MAG: zinc-ribbon domain-containing protein [Candidatus Heimdallarchaeaceae archaeon]
MNMKFFSILFLFVLIVLPIVSGTDCKVARPQKEVLTCTARDEILPEVSFNCNTWTDDYQFCVAKYECKTDDCEVPLENKREAWMESTGCEESGNMYARISKNGELQTEVVDGVASEEGWDEGDIDAKEFDEILIEARCYNTWQTKKKIPTGGYVLLKDKNKFLKAENFDWPPHTILNTKNCIPQEAVKDKLEEQIKTGDTPSETKYEVNINEISLDVPMQTGHDISFFYRWDIEESINLKYNSEGEEVYCGNKKLYNYHEIKTVGGDCYLIPGNVQTNVECCSDSDCPISGEYCGEGFVCTDNKPCNSDIECGSEEGTCTNKQKSWYECKDVSGGVRLPNGMEYEGYCTMMTAPVSCCPGDCGNGQHCEENKGCVSDIQLNKCPSGKCCDAGGSYFPRECASGLICCKAPGGFVGDCKESCEPIKEEGGTAENQLKVNNTPPKSGSNLGLIIGIILAVLVIGGGLFYYFYYFRGREVYEEEEPKPHKKASKKTKGKGKHCKQCGVQLSAGDKFCTKCGKKQ